MIAHRNFDTPEEREYVPGHCPDCKRPVMASGWLVLIELSYCSRCDTSYGVGWRRLHKNMLIGMFWLSLLGVWKVWEIIAWMWSKLYG